MNDLPASVIEAFHLMWGNYPDPASLVHKSRMVAAVNKAHEKLGVLKPGMNCARLGAPEAHRGCKAEQALASGEAAYAYMMKDGRERLAFWLPLDGCPEYYVHFSVGATIAVRLLSPDAGAD